MIRLGLPLRRRAIGRIGSRRPMAVRSASARAARAARARRAPEPSPRAPEASPSVPDEGRRRMRRTVALAALGALLCIPLAIGARHLAANKVFRIRTVVVQASAHVGEDEIRSLAAIEPGMPWFLFDRRAAEERLEAHPWIERARVRRPWPGRVRITVEECQPVARVEVAGRTYGLCDDLRIVPEGDAALPMVRGHDGREKTDPEALARSLDYVAALRKAGIAGHEPVDLDVAGGTGDCLVLPDRGFTVTVDELVPVPVAMRNVLAFLETLDAEGGSRGTLRLVSGDTAVWRANTTRPHGTG